MSFIPPVSFFFQIPGFVFLIALLLPTFVKVTGKRARVRFLKSVKFESNAF